MKQIVSKRRRSVRERLETFEKNNRWGLRTLVFGGMVMLIARLLQGALGDIIPSLVTALNFAAYFAIFIGFLALCVNMEKKRVSSVFVFAASVLTVGVLCFFFLAVPPEKGVGFIDNNSMTNRIAQPSHEAIYYTSTVLSGVRTPSEEYSEDNRSTVYAPKFTVVGNGYFNTLVSLEHR